MPMRTTSASVAFVALVAFAALVLVSSDARAQDPLPQLPPNENPPAPNQPPAPSKPAAKPDAPTSEDFGAPAPKEDEAEGKKSRLSFRFNGGYQLGRLHSVPTNGGRFRAGVGAQTDSSAHYATISLLYGSTDQGLRAWDFRVGWQGDFLRYKILRAGVDVEAGYMFVRRVTEDRRIWAFGIGAGIHAGVDVFSWGPRDDHAITIDARLDGHIHFGTAPYWGPTLMAGLRF
jgi:hypothetical protein